MVDMVQSKNLHKDAQCLDNILNKAAYNNTPCDQDQLNDRNAYIDGHNQDDTDIVQYNHPLDKTLKSQLVL